MKRYLIERQIPGVGSLGAAQYRELAERSNRAIAQLGGRLQWIHSLVAANQTFCVYIAQDEAVLREHGRLAGFPVTKIHEIGAVLDPLYAYPAPMAKAA